MTAAGISSYLPPRTARAFWLAAALAGALSLAAAIVAITQPGAPASSTAPAVDELAARNQRIAFFEARVQADPLDYPDLNILAREYLQRARETGNIGDYARAEYAASTSLAIMPTNNYNGLIALGSVRLINHDFAGAHELADQALVLKPDQASAYGIRGDASFNLGDYQAAEKDYNRMVAIEPTLPALSRLAGLAFVRGEKADSIDFWRQALAGDDGLPVENVAWAHVQLGGVYFAYGDLKSAERQYESALALLPDFPAALAGLGGVRAANDDLPEAIALYQQAINRAPQVPYVIALGDIYTKAVEPEKAATEYALVEAIDKLYRANGINTDLQLALFYADHNQNLDEALAMAQRVYATSPSIYAADALAWALFKNGRPEEALPMSAQAIRLNTPDASFYYHAGVIRQALGDRAGAVAALKRSLELNPSFSPLHAAEAKQLLDQLGGGR